MGAMADDDGAGRRRLAGEVLVSSRDGGRSWSDAQPAGENSRMNRKDSATSATVVSARSQGRVHRHHQEELRHGGAAGAAANACRLSSRVNESTDGTVARWTLP